MRPAGQTGTIRLTFRASSPKQAGDRTVHDARGPCRSGRDGSRSPRSADERAFVFRTSHPPADRPRQRPHSRAEVEPARTGRRRWPSTVGSQGGRGFGVTGPYSSPLPRPGREGHCEGVIAGPSGIFQDSLSCDRSRSPSAFRGLMTSTRLSATGAGTTDPVASRNPRSSSARTRTPARTPAADRPQLVTSPIAMRHRNGRPARSG